MWSNCRNFYARIMSAAVQFRHSLVSSGTEEQWHMYSVGTFFVSRKNREKKRSPETGEL